MKIEVELRSFITKKQYDDLAKRFSLEGEYQGEDIQETIYFHAPLDLRVQKNKFGTKIWAKEGKLHETARNELELLCRDEDYDSAINLFIKLGLNPTVKWWRKRKTFFWRNVTVTLDYTRNYGYIVELELCVKDGKDKAIHILSHLFNELGLEITPKKEFDSRYNEYVQNHQLKK
jgi:predicted adenylyl cyclase CyaB